MVLALPGWKQPALDVVERGGAGVAAEEHGVALLLAETGVTVYESGFFAETRDAGRWCGAGCSLGGARWTGEVVVPFAIDRAGPVPGAIGISSGGEGVVVVAGRYGDLPRVCAMSGTYDLFALPEKSGEYRIHAQSYGSRTHHPERWRAADSLSRSADLRDVGVLLLHGAKDRVVAPTQAERMAAALRALEPPVAAEVAIEPTAGHDWSFWSASMERCMAFVAE